MVFEYKEWKRSTNHEFDTIIMSNDSIVKIEWDESTFEITDSERTDDYCMSVIGKILGKGSDGRVYSCFVDGSKVSGAPVELDWKDVDSLEIEF